MTSPDDTVSLNIAQPAGYFLPQRLARLPVMTATSNANPAKEPRVGIVIPVYNTGSLARAAARSAFAALGSHDSIIVVDDGSTDATTIATLADLREEGFIVHRQENGGVSAARNAGIALLRAPYVIALDSDDEVLPGAPSLMADAMDADDAVALVTGAAYEERGGVETLRAAPDEAVTRQSMRDYSLVATASLFRRAAWAEVGGFPEGVSLGEDWIFWMRILREGGTVSVLNEPTIRRHLGDHQVTAGRIDVRKSTRAQAIVRLENADLYVGQEQLLIHRLNAAETHLAAYRHAYRHLDRFKSAARTVLSRARDGRRP